MLYKTLSAALSTASTPILFRCEVDYLASGKMESQDHFHTVGLPDAAVRESRDRVRAALKTCGYDIPPTHITINLATSRDIKMEGQDSTSQWPSASSEPTAASLKEPDCLFVGELSLDGGIRGIRGTLPIALEARSRKISRLVVPESNAREAAMVLGVDVYPVPLAAGRNPLREFRQRNRSAESRIATLCCVRSRTSWWTSRCTRPANRQACHRGSPALEAITS